MKIELKLGHYVGISLGLLIIILSIFFLLLKESPFFNPALAIGIACMILPFWLGMLKQNAREREIEEKFLEFVRAITGSVRSGIPIPKAIKESSTANYGSLTRHIKKLAYQIEWGIPLKDSLNNFAKATKNKVIKRSVAIIVEAEKSGGNIQDVMEGVTLSVVQIKKIKDERRSSAFSQIIQGYIVFFIFIAVMIVLQLFLLPQLSEATYDVFQGMTFDFTAGATGEIGDQREIAIDFDNLFMILILIQGFFTGLMIGKFSEGSIKHGIRHSFILMLVGYLLFTISLSIF